MDEISQPTTDDLEETSKAATLSRTACSRRRFVIVALLLHAIVTLWNLPYLGHTGGPFHNGLYEHYFVYTSIPIVFLAPFVSEPLESSNAFLVCLVSNGVVVAWLFATGLHHIVYGNQYDIEQSREPENAIRRS